MKDIEGKFQTKNEMQDSLIKLNNNLIRLEISKDQRIFQWEKLKYLLLCFVSIILLCLIRGSDKMPSLIGVEK